MKNEIDDIVKKTIDDDIQETITVTLRDPQNDNGDEFRPITLGSDNDINLEDRSIYLG